MTPVYQTADAPGVNGDCFAACLASVLDLPLDVVPDFYGDAANGKLLPNTMSQLLTTWLRGHGWGYAEFGFPFPTVSDMLVRMAEELPETTYLLSGRTMTYRTHCVVGRGGKIIHDPGTHGDHTLRGPCHDGFFRVGLFLWPK